MHNLSSVAGDNETHRCQDPMWYRELQQTLLHILCFYLVPGITKAASFRAQAVCGS